MIRGTLLPALVGIELLAAAGLVGWRIAQPVAPAVNAARLDGETAADFQRLREEAGVSGENWRELGEAYLAFGYFPEAEACYRRSFDLLPESFETVYGWAYALQRLGRMEEAAGRFEVAAGIAPAEMITACWYHIGRCFLRLEDVRSAESAFRRYPKFPPSSYQLAKILVRSARGEEAIPILERLIEDHPEALQPYWLRGRAEEALGREEAALEYRERSERASDRLPLSDHHQFLTPIRLRYGASRRVAGNVRLLDRGRRREAARGFHEMMGDLEVGDRRKLAPMLAELELELGHPERAAELLNGLFEHSNVTPHTLMLAGDALAMQGKDDDAARTWERVVRMRPGTAVHRRLAEHSEGRGDQEGARHHAARALCYAGMEAFRRDDLQAARETLRQAVQLDPEHDRSWFYLGETLRALGRTRSAGEAYENCLERNPAHGRARSAAARLQ